MAEALKNMYNLDFYRDFGALLQKELPNFNQQIFEKQIFVKEWPDLELKQRMRHSTKVLHYWLPKDYPKAIQHINNLIKKLEQKPIFKNSFPFIFFSDYVELYGQQDYQTSVDAMESITQFITAEFCIRLFIVKYPKTMTQMLLWSKHKNHHVRRLASEGCRPRLPWAMALPSLKKDPSEILPILENLKADDSLYVRRSVANNMNDIAKDHPDLVLKIASKWLGKNEDTNWIVKHACRSLLKKGNTEALKLFGWKKTKGIEVLGLKIEKKSIAIGQSNSFSFSLENKSSKAVKIRLEYGVYFMKKNGSQSRKVFKLSELELGANSSRNFERKQAFRELSTRKHYAGQHRISIIVNGQESGELSFELTKAV